MTSAAGEDPDEPTCELAGLVAVARVEMHLPAARLRAREMHVVPEPLEQPDGCDPRLGHQRVGQAGDEQRDAQAARIISPGGPASFAPSHWWR